MKNIPVLERCIKCPKCQNNTMRKSIPQKQGFEYFCDTCRLYFGIWELCNHWNYDMGDFCEHVNFEQFPKFVPEIFVQYTQCLDCGKKLYEDVTQISTTWFEDATSICDEPVWKTISERKDAYEMVERMFLGIQEWEYERRYNAVDTGL